MKKKTYGVIFGLTVSIYALYILSYLGIFSVQAINMDSSQFRINFSNVNFGSNNQTSTNFNLSTTAGQLAANEFASSGYIVKAGFQYIHSIIPFSFTISKTSIDLGTLTPQTASTDTATLTVAFGGAGQYQVTAIETDTLKTISGSSFIPDTTCDSGTCTESSAGVWSSSTAYGFGYNMSGTGIPSDFTDSTYYRPFPSEAAAESPQLVMSSTNVTKSDQSTVTFRANVSSVQAAGTYQTIVKFTATPSY